MRKKGIIGRRVDLSKIGKEDLSITYEENMYDYPSIEVFLSDFVYDGPTDRYGYNAYSVLIFLENEKVKDVQRMGHLHMCGGQGSDFDMSRFPHPGLEAEAEKRLKKLVKDLAP